jgi:hypothetical protein
MGNSFVGDAFARQALDFRNIVDQLLLFRIVLVDSRRPAPRTTTVDITGKWLHRLIGLASDRITSASTSKTRLSLHWATLKRKKRFAVWETLKTFPGANTR